MRECGEREKGKDKDAVNSEGVGREGDGSR